MNDMSPVIVPRSDQVNAEDFLAGPRTYTIESVDIQPDTEQPVSVHLGGEKRVWRPCKSMSRVLVAAWGADANLYTGRSVTLYHDRTVKWGGMEVGGIRISHLSHLGHDMQMALTETRGKRKPFVVKMLAGSTAAKHETKAATDKAADGARRLIERVNSCVTEDDLRALTADETVKKQRLWLGANRPELSERVDAAVSETMARVTDAPFDAPIDDFPGVVTPREPEDADSILPPRPLDDLRRLMEPCRTMAALDATMRGETWKASLAELTDDEKTMLRKDVDAQQRSFRATTKTP